MNINEIKKDFLNGEISVKFTDSTVQTISICQFIEKVFDQIKKSELSGKMLPLQIATGSFFTKLAFDQNTNNLPPPGDRDIKLRIISKEKSKDHEKIYQAVIKSIKSCVQKNKEEDFKSYQFLRQFRGNYSCLEKEKGIANFNFTTDPKPDLEFTISFTNEDSEEKPIRSHRCILDAGSIHLLEDGSSELYFYEGDEQAIEEAVRLKKYYTSIPLKKEDCTIPMLSHVLALTAYGFSEQGQTMLPVILNERISNTTDKNPSLVLFQKLLQYMEKKRPEVIPYALINLALFLKKDLPDFSLSEHDIIDLLIEKTPKDDLVLSNLLRESKTAESPLDFFSFSFIKRTNSINITQHLDSPHIHCLKTEPKGRNLFIPFPRSSITRRNWMVDILSWESSKERNDLFYALCKTVPQEEQTALILDVLDSAILKTDNPSPCFLKRQHALWFVLHCFLYKTPEESDKALKWAFPNIEGKNDFEKLAKLFVEENGLYLDSFIPRVKADKSKAAFIKEIALRDPNIFKEKLLPLLKNSKEDTIPTYLEAIDNLFDAQLFDEIFEALIDHLSSKQKIGVLIDFQILKEKPSPSFLLKYEKQFSLSDLLYKQGDKSKILDEIISTFSKEKIKQLSIEALELGKKKIFLQLFHTYEIEEDSSLIQTLLKYAGSITEIEDLLKEKVKDNKFWKKITIQAIANKDLKLKKQLYEMLFTNSGLKALIDRGEDLLQTFPLLIKTQGRLDEIYLKIGLLFEDFQWLTDEFLEQKSFRKTAESLQKETSLCPLDFHSLFKTLLEKQEWKKSLLLLNDLQVLFPQDPALSELYKSLETAFPSAVERFNTLKEHLEKILSESNRKEFSNCFKRYPKLFEWLEENISQASLSCLPNPQLAIKKLYLEKKEDQILIDFFQNASEEEQIQIVPFILDLSPLLHEKLLNQFCPSSSNWSLSRETVSNECSEKWIKAYLTWGGSKEDEISSERYKKTLIQSIEKFPKGFPNEFLTSMARCVLKMDQKEIELFITKYLSLPIKEKKGIKTVILPLIEGLSTPFLSPEKPAFRSFWEILEENEQPIIFSLKTSDSLANISTYFRREILVLSTKIEDIALKSMWQQRLLAGLKLEQINELLEITKIQNTLKEDICLYKILLKTLQDELSNPQKSSKQIETTIERLLQINLKETLTEDNLPLHEKCLFSIEFLERNLIKSKEKQKKVKEIYLWAFQLFLNTQKNQDNFIRFIKDVYLPLLEKLKLPLDNDQLSQVENILFSHRDDLSKKENVYVSCIRRLFHFHKTNINKSDRLSRMSSIFSSTYAHRFEDIQNVDLVKDGPILFEYSIINPDDNHFYPVEVTIGFLRIVELLDLPSEFNDMLSKILEISAEYVEKKETHYFLDFLSVNVLNYAKNLKNDKNLEKIVDYIPTKYSSLMRNELNTFIPIPKEP